MARRTQAGLFILLALGLVIASLCLSPVQTALLNAWARSAGHSFTVESASLGLSGFEIEDFNLRTQHGRWRLPHLEGTYRLGDLLKGELRFGEIRARDWTFISWEEEPKADTSPLRGEDALKTGAERLRAALELPRPIQIGSLDLEGEWRRHAQSGIGERTHLKVQIRGSVESGTSTKLEMVLWGVESEKGGGQFVEVNARGALQAQYASATRINRLALTFTASATGPAFPNGAVLSSRLELRANDKDTSIDLFVYGSGDSDARELVVVRAGTEVGTGAMKGTWSLDLTHTDLAPYSLGFEIPHFAVRGSGAFAFDRALRIAGDAEGTITPRFSAPDRAPLPEVGIRGVFDVTYNDGEWLSHRASARLSAGTLEVAALVLQPVRWKPGNLPLPTSPDGDWVQIEWRGLDSVFLATHAAELPASFSASSGGVVLGYRGGSIQGRLVRALILPNFVPAGLPAGATTSSLVLDGRASWQPGALQIDLSRVEYTRAESRTLNGRGQVSLSGPQLSDTFTLSASFDSDLESAQYLSPRYFSNLAGGLAQVQTTATGTPEAWQAQMEVKVLGASAKSGQQLPPVTASIRLDRNQNGSYDVEAPLTFSQGQDLSDVTLLAHLERGQVAWRTDALITSKRLQMQHVRALRSLDDKLEVAMATASQPGTLGPFWNGLRGRLRVGLEQVIWPDRPQRLAVQMEAAVNETSLVLHSLRLEHENGGSLLGKAEIHHTGTNKRPYQYAGLVEAKEFDPAPYLRFLDPTRPALVEGKFDLEMRAKGQVSSLLEIADASEIQVNLTGRGGVFHAFDASASGFDPAKVGSSSSTLTNLIGLASSIIGKQEKRVAAATSFLRKLTNLAYDQATFELTHKPGADTEIREFSLITPELRFRGEGVLQANAMIPWDKRYMRLQLDVAARGESEWELRTLGLVSDKPDTLGYYSLGRPLRFDGTLRDLGTAALIDVVTQAVAR
ncbi:MAG: hypothetical protein SFV32_14250 [Opitutaceae bacterium]|nr:hypothetical protein [Opitutaceae bacterium]